MIILIQIAMFVLSYHSNHKYIESGKYRYGYVSLKVKDLVNWKNISFTRTFKHADPIINQKLIENNSQITIICHESYYK